MPARAHAPDRLTRRLAAGASAAALLALLGTPVARAADPAPAPSATTAKTQDALIARGKYLATAADCGPCHTGPGMQPYSGGRYVSTPFGKIASPNITPDKATGIGNWTDAQFYDALHQGIGRSGEYLYPVMPFPWYTKVTHDDALAIRAYLASLKPVHAPQKPNELEFPFNIRTGLLAWRTAFFHEGTFKPDPSKSEQINRGAYLVTALGHCSECHGEAIFGASMMAKPFEGGSVDHWYAPNITSDPKEGIGSWTEDQLATYFKTGTAEGKSVALGPMHEVVHDSLSQLSDADRHAIAAYLKSTVPEEKYSADKLQAFAGRSGPGANIYLNHCSSCHQQNGKGVANEVPPLAGNGAVVAQGPENVIRVILAGIPAQGDYRQMPALGADMTDQQIADVANYVRNSWSNAAPRPAQAGEVGKLRAYAFIQLAGPHPSCVEPGSHPKQDALSKTIADPKSGIQPLLAAVTPDNMINKVGELVVKLHSVAPHAAKADTVNDLTTAYCPIIAADTKLDENNRRWQLQRFAQVVYSQLTSPDKVVDSTK